MADILDAAAQKVIDDAAKNAVPSDPATTPTPTSETSSPAASVKVDVVTPATQTTPVTTSVVTEQAKPEQPATMPADLPAEKPLIVSADPTVKTEVTVTTPAPSMNTIPPMPTPPTEPAPTPAAEQPKATSAGFKGGKKGGKIGTMLVLAFLLVAAPLIGLFATNPQIVADLRSRASGENVGKCEGTSYTYAGKTYACSGITEEVRCKAVQSTGADCRWTTTAGGGGGEAPTQPPAQGCSTAFSCNGICETNQATIDNFNNTWCDGLARWKWQACGEGSEPTAQKPNCGGAQPTPTPTPPASSGTQGRCEGTSYAYQGKTYACSGITEEVRCKAVQSTGADCRWTTTAGGGGGGETGGTGGGGKCEGTSYAYQGKTYACSGITEEVRCKAVQSTGADCRWTTTAGGGGGGESCQNLNCTISDINWESGSFKYQCNNANNIDTHTAVISCAQAGLTACNTDASYNVQFNGSAGNSGTVTFTPPNCGTVQIDAGRGDLGLSCVTGYVHTYGGNCAGGSNPTPTLASCGNWCSPGGPWAGTCCNSLSEGSQCKHTWDEGHNAACVTPTQPPGGQCMRISVYKGNDKVTNLSTLQAGDQITIGVAGSTADKGRIRVNGGTFTETTTKNSQSEYTINFTIPASVTQFTIEAEVFSGGTWH